MAVLTTAKRHLPKEMFFTASFTPFSGATSQVFTCHAEVVRVLEHVPPTSPDPTLF